MKNKTLSDKMVKIYTGDIIEGCEEWYAHYPERNVKEFIKELKEGSLIDNLTRVCWEEFEMERFQTLEETLEKLKLKIKGQVKISIDKLAGEKLI